MKQIAEEREAISSPVGNTASVLLARTGHLALPIAPQSGARFALGNDSKSFRSPDLLPTCQVKFVRKNQIMITKVVTVKQ